MQSNGSGSDVSLDASTTPSASAKPAKVKRGTVTRNPVVVAISKISAILDEFDGETQDRILGFVNEQYSK